MLLRSGRGGRCPVSRPIRCGRDARTQPRPLDRGRARAARRRVEPVDRLDLCTACDPDSSSRIAATPVDGASGSDRLRRLRPSARTTNASAREVGDGVTVVAATKYVALEDMARARRRRRRGRRREPRAGARGESTRVRRRVPLALHRPPAVEQGEGRESHVRARALARLRLGGGAADRPGARRGEPGGRDIEVRHLPGGPAALPRALR